MCRLLNDTLSSHLTGVYDPRAFFLHAALLDQGFPHCPIFPTAASRRSLGRVSVPVWPIALSGRLSIVAMVGRYPTIKLIERGPLRKCQLTCRGQLSLSNRNSRDVCGISSSFPKLSPASGQVAHVLLTRSPLYSPPEGSFLARLACVKHAASVHSEPGSNSPVEKFEIAAGRLNVRRRRSSLQKMILVASSLRKITARNERKKR